MPIQSAQSGSCSAPSVTVPPAGTGTVVVGVVVEVEALVGAVVLDDTDEVVALLPPLPLVQAAASSPEASSSAIALPRRPLLRTHGLLRCGRDPASIRRAHR